MKENQKTADRQSTFLSGVFLLSLSAMITKVTGLITKIPMLRLLGAGAMGYYNTAYELYAFLFVLSTAGLPVALSILISKEREAGHHARIFKIALWLFLSLGTVGGGGLFLFATPIAAAIGNTAAAAAIRAIAPAVLFISLAAAIRGYYQGRQNMVPTAISQVIEAVGKLLFGLLFATSAVRRGLPLPQVAAAGAWGLSAATALSLLYLICRLSRDNARERAFGQEKGSADSGRKRASGGILRPLLAIALPITLSSGVITLTRLLDMVLILRRMGMCGYTEAAVSALYGTYSTLAVPLYSLLPMLVSSVALPLVPGITRARESGDRAAEREMVDSAFRLTFLLAVPASLGMSAFSRPILQLLFGGSDAAAVAQAVPLLSTLSISILGSCLVTILGAMLQAYGRPRIPLLAMSIASVAKLLSAWILLGIPRFGMLGAPMSTFVCNLIAICIDLGVLHRLLPRGIHLPGLCMRTLAASSLSVGGALVLWRIMARSHSLPSVSVLAVILLCMACYTALVFLFRVLRAEDVVRYTHTERAKKASDRQNCPSSGENCAKNQKIMG